MQFIWLLIPAVVYMAAKAPDSDPCARSKNMWLLLWLLLGSLAVALAQNYDARQKYDRYQQAIGVCESRYNGQVVSSNAERTVWGCQGSDGYVRSIQN